MAKLVFALKQPVKHSELLLNCYSWTNISFSTQFFKNKFVLKVIFFRGYKECLATNCTSYLPIRLFGSSEFIKFMPWAFFVGRRIPKPVSRTYGFPVIVMERVVRINMYMIYSKCKKGIFRHGVSRSTLIFEALIGQCRYFWCSHRSNA